MSKKSFLRGAVVLGAAGLVIKALGAVFRIPLANIIGDTGMGYYQTAYPVYVLLLTLSTAGIPVAISRMVAERQAVERPGDAYRVFQVSFVLLAGIGLASFAVLFFGAGAIVGKLGNPGAEAAMMAVAPALLIVPMMAASRGFFQGMQDMKPTAASQIVEQLFRVAAGLTLAIVLVSRGLPAAAAGASFGATAGAAAGLVAILLIFWRRRPGILAEIRERPARTDESGGRILGQIFAIAVPITVGAAIMPIMNTIDVAIVINRLADSGFSPEDANRLYGQLTGMAGPLINFPQVLTQAISMSLVPAVAAAYKRQEMEDLRHNVELGLRTALILGLPSAIGLMALSEPVMRLLYPAQTESAVNAAPSLFILAFGVIFLATVQTLTGVLQGVGKQMIPVCNLAVGAVVKIVLTYSLTGIPSVNIRGAAVGTVAAYIVASTLNLLAVRRITGARFHPGLTLGRPLAAAVSMGLLAFASHRLLFALLAPALGRDSLANAAATGAAVLVGVIAYLTLLLVFRAIRREELDFLPGGKRLVRLLERFGK